MFLSSNSTDRVVSEQAPFSCFSDIIYMNEYILYIKLVICSRFRVRILSGREWRTNFVGEENTISIYANMSEMNYGAGTWLGSSFEQLRGNEVSNQQLQESYKLTGWQLYLSTI